MPKDSVQNLSSCLLSTDLEVKIYSTMSLPFHYQKKKKKQNVDGEERPRDIRTTPRKTS
jgi:hypothetical protein